MSIIYTKDFKKGKEENLYKRKVIRVDRICNKCRGLIKKKTKAIFWYHVPATKAYSHIKCLTL